MGRMMRSHENIWVVDKLGKTTSMFHLGGLFLTKDSGNGDLRGLRQAIQWTRLSFSLWLQDVRQILGRKA